MAGALPAATQATAQINGQKMTLRRFVRVTIDNFRQLLQTISTPATSLPMPQLVPLPAASSFPPSNNWAANGADNEAHPANGHAPANSAFGGDTLDDEQVGDEQVGNEQVEDKQVGDEQVGNERVDDQQFGASNRDDFADGAPDDQAPSIAPVADASGSDSSLSPSHPLAPSPAHDGEPSEPDTTARFPLAAALESLLFVCDEAVEPARLAQALGIAPAEAEAALLALDTAYRQERRGLRLQVRNGRYQLVTAPEAANLIENFLNLDASTRLSAPALETLAVVAYRQPVTRSQIEAVRGVDCSGVLRSLLSRGLLEEVGRLDAPGRPVLYGVTDLFMHHFGLTALHELPPLEDAELARIEEAGA